MDWKPDAIEGWVLEAGGDRWTIRVYSVMDSGACQWAQLALHGSRTYQLLVSIAPWATPFDILAGLERWLERGDEPIPGVQIHAGHEGQSPAHAPPVQICNSSLTAESLPECPLTDASNPTQSQSVRKTVHPLLKQLGATIRSLRVQRKLSQEALADLAAIDRSYMSGIERGLRNLSVLHAVRIANALEISLSNLLSLHPGGSPDMAGSPWLLPDNDANDANDASAAARALDEVQLAVAGIRSIGRDDLSELEVGWEVGRYLSLG